MDRFTFSSEEGHGGGAKAGNYIRNGIINKVSCVALSFVCGCVERRDIRSLLLFYRITGFGLVPNQQWLMAHRATVMGSNCFSQGKNFYKLHGEGISNTTENGEKHDTSGFVSSLSSGLLRLDRSSSSSKRKDKWKALLSTFLMAFSSLPSPPSTIHLVNHSVFEERV